MAYQKSLGSDGYLNEFHRESSQAAQEEVKRMRLNPISKADMRKQMSEAITPTSGMSGAELEAHRKEKRRKYLERIGWEEE